MKTVTGEKNNPTANSVKQEKVIHSEASLYTPVFERDVLLIDLPLHVSVGWADAFTANVLRILQQTKCISAQCISISKYQRPLDLKLIL